MAQVESRELGKLLWRCRRGVKELDVLLTRYVEQQFCEAPPAHQEAFRTLLETPDMEIYGYLLGQRRPPTALLSSLIERIIGRALDD